MNEPATTIPPYPGGIGIDGSASDRKRRAFWGSACSGARAALDDGPEGVKRVRPVLAAVGGERFAQAALDAAAAMPRHNP